MNKLFLLFILLVPSVMYPQALNPGDVLNIDKMTPKGEYYDANVPATLDLAQRAELAINNLTRAPWDTIISKESISEKLSKEALLKQEEISKKLASSPAFINIKQLRTLPKLRAMCGSSQNLKVEYEAMEKMLNAAVGAFASDNNEAKTAYRSLAVVAANWYHRDGNNKWLEWISATAQAVKESIIQKGDIAYYPTGKEENQFVPYNPPDEPPIDQIGREGTVRWDQSWGLRSLIRNYKFNNDKASLELAQKNLNFLLKPGMWKDNGKLDFPGNEHGLWEGHFHGGAVGLQAILDMAMAEDNQQLKNFVSEAYQYGRHYGIVRMGWFPMWFPTGSFNRPVEQSSYCETCGVADFTILAVKLSLAGLGDYWDDIDYYVRNQLSEQQFTDLDMLKKCVDNDPNYFGLLERMLGGFGLSEPTLNGYFYTQFKPQVVTGCCSPNGALAYYYTWYGMTTFDKGVATINLLLNRASKWMDIDSYLPYEGKVILHNKLAHTALVKMPHWVDLKTVKCSLNGTDKEPIFSGRYLLISNLERSDKIIIEFDQPISQSVYTIYDTKYTIDYKGSTIVGINPRRKGVYPIYQREQFKQNKTPITKIKRFVTDKLIPLP